MTNDLLNVSFALFLGAAMLGITMMVIILQKRKAPRGIVFSHGGLALTALILLIVAAVQYPGSVPVLSLVLFPIAALIGAYMFFRDITAKKFPRAVMFVHASFAVIAFAALFIFIFGWGR